MINYWLVQGIRAPWLPVVWGIRGLEQVEDILCSNLNRLIAYGQKGGGEGAPQDLARPNRLLVLQNHGDTCTASKDP